MNFEEYRAIKAINFSSLKSMKKSPKQFKHDLDNGIVDSTGKALGRATHTAVLEPDKFNDEYAIFDGKIRKGEDWKQFQKEHGHKTILKREEAEHCLEIAREVRANHVAAYYLSKGTAEKTLVWKDKVTGLDCKARVDFLSEVDNKLTLVDLKGCRNVQAESFRIEAGKNGYHRQLAFYQQGIAENYNGLVVDCVIIAVEFNAPFDCAVFKLEEEALIAGAHDNAEFLQKVASCQIDNRWPGCYSTIQDLVLRRWETGISDGELSDLELDFTETSQSEG